MTTSARAGADDPADLRRAALGVLLPGFSGTTRPPAWVPRLLAQGLPGVCLYGENVVDDRTVRILTDAIRDADPEAIVAIDEEGGDVTRLYYDVGSPYPGNALLGRVDDLEWTVRVADRVGRAVAAAGATLVLGPVADVNANPDNPVIGVRSFGADPGLVARHTAAWVRAVEATGVASCTKHFPGHGDTATDSHLGLPVLDLDLPRLRERDLPPFAAAAAAGGRAVMTSHILLPALDPDRPATHSPAILQGLLRRDLGYAGAIVSDALDMAGASAGIGIPESAVRAIAAGCDLLCLGVGNTEEQLEEIVAALQGAVASGRLPADRLRDAAARAARLRGAPPRGPEQPRILAAGDLQRALSGFVLGAAARSWLERHPGGPDHIVVLDSAVNIAAGHVPWGIDAAIADPARRPAPPPPAVVHHVGPGDAIPDRLEGPVVVVGKDLHRHAFAVQAVETLLARGQAESVLTVEMGWPDPRRGLADVCTYGASRLCGAALLALLSGDTDR